MKAHPRRESLSRLRLREYSPLLLHIDAGFSKTPNFRPSLFGVDALMTYLTKLQGALAFACLGLLGSMPLAQAKEELTVSADHSQIVRMERAPGTVVVGNPSIADVTIQGNQLFIHGRGFGKTNVIVLDEAGNPLAEYAVNVQLEDDYNVAVFKGGGQQATYSCKTDCEAALHIGDDKDRFKLVQSQQNDKLGIAQGQKPGDETSSSGQGGQAQ